LAGIKIVRFRYYWFKSKNSWFKS